MPKPAASSSDQRPYDIIVYGASGFTGNLTANYLAQCNEANQLRWAIAGRSKSKLQECQKALQTAHPNNVPDIITADSSDLQSLKKMTSQGKVIITTVGPYLKYGEPLVEACIETGTHYVDLTGEPEFVEGLEFKFQAQAAQKQVKIVNSCGFDSIPHDLGALYTLHELNALIGPDRSEKVPVKIEGFVQAQGTFSGGTWHSAITQFSRMKEFNQKRSYWKKNQPQTRSDGRRVKLMAPTIKYMTAFSKWACAFPTIDPIVVKRTAKKRAEFGPDFVYGHYVLVKQLPKLLGGLIGVGGLLALSQIKFTREQLLKIKDPGDGPSESTRQKSWFKVRFIGSADGLNVWTEVSGGDPGYGETSKMLAESALCLAFDKDLPEEFGIVTTGAAMGVALIARLKKAGISFKTIQ